MSTLIARIAAATAFTIILASGGAFAEPTHAIAMHGDPKYAAGFEHFDYADPDAPQGGALVQAATGSYDSLNPFIVTGTTASGVRANHFPQMMARAWDEPFTLYPYVAETIETPEDRSWVEFHLNPAAQWHDGTPITVDDVIFTIETLREKGLPSFRRNYGRIASMERVGERGIRFVFNDQADRETPLIMGLMPIISKAWYSAHPFDEPSLEIPLGGGPYQIDQVDPGRSIIYEKVENWWGNQLGSFRGQNNFETLRVDYFRDSDVALEAFKAGETNLQRESNAERWVSGAYDFPAVADGRVTLAEVTHGRPEGMRGFVFNTRAWFFMDPRVRFAINLAFDFDFVNNTLLQGQYKRLDSFFANSELAARGVPEGAELALLEPFRDQLPPFVFSESLPVTDVTTDARQRMREALGLLADAGWEVVDGTLTYAGGAPMAFEILLNSQADERIALAFIDNLRRIGIRANARVVDSAQFTARIEAFDFDMIIWRWGVTLSPGAEQHLYWHSASADTNGTRNYPGVKSPVVDALIDAIGNAVDRDELVAATRALDRVLQSGYYVVPLYYFDRDLVAYWGGLGRVTDVDPVYGTVLEAWWADPMGP